MISQKARDNANWAVERRFGKAEQLRWVDFLRNVSLIAASEEMTKTRRPCQNHSPTFKAKVSIAGIKGEKTLIELLQNFDIHPDEIKLRMRIETLYRQPKTSKLKPGLRTYNYLLRKLPVTRQVPVEYIKDC